MSELFERLQEHRLLLLACEAIGWLHMTGKAKVEFLKKHAGAQIEYDEKKWHEDKNVPFEWNDSLKWLKENFNDLPWPQELSEFIVKHTNKDKGILGLLQAAHGIVSGVEKNIPSETSKYLQQNIPNMWLSSAFGNPEKNLLGNPTVLTDERWESLMTEVQRILTQLQERTSKNKDNIEDLWKWRDDAIGKNSLLRKMFTSTLAETRIPNNDVTLWDQSYVAAALFKSAVAGAIIEGNFNWTNANLKQEAQWRLLTIGIGAEHYESRAVKIPDWTGARQQIDDFFNNVCKFVEINLAVGSLLYRDSEVFVFSFPGERMGETKDVLKIKEWEKEITQEIDKYAQKIKFETPPYCAISEKSSRSLVCMTKEIQKARNVMAVPIHRGWEITGEDQNKGHVCPVCLVRRNGEGSKKLKLCQTCKDRKEGRLNKWLQQKDKNTIWISEVADSDDRGALVTMSLDIEPWLDGTRLDSLRAQAILGWSNNSRLKQNPINANKPFDSFLAYTKKKLDEFSASDNVFGSIHEGFKEENNWKTFFSKIVEDRSVSPKWDPQNNDQNARWLTHQFFCKLASPGRVYRFQQQAKKFFSGLLDDFASENDNPWRTRRLVLKLDNSTAEVWENHQVCNGHCENSPLDLLYRKDTDDFLTISNLARLLKPEQGKAELVGKKLTLKAEDEEGKDLMIQSVSEGKGDLYEYCPVISLEISPVRFRVLVPLEDVSAFVDKAVEKWQKEFSRVWDRLPLRVGVVAFPRKTPFQSVIEMTRAVEEKLQVKKPETWAVSKCEPSEDEIKLALTRQDNLQEEQKVPLKFEDGREDVFYPYFAVKANKCCCPLDFQHPEGQVYRHVKDLKADDEIYVYPSEIITAFMDNTAVRFEQVIKHGLMDWNRMQDIWELINEVVPSQTALRGAWSEIIERRDAWQGDKEAWLDFVKAVVNKQWKVKGEDLDALVQAAGDGILNWALDFRVTMLKQKIRED